MTIHQTEGIHVPDFVPTIELDAGFLFLTCKENDRLSISTTIERLINMLDDMEPDCDLEPWLGSGDDREADSADDEPSLGWTTSGHLGSTLPEEDECEKVSEDEGAITGDDEYSLGWSEEDSINGNLSAGSFGTEGELEPELGWTEEVDQVRRLKRAEGWMVDDSEPDLGWAESHGRGIVGEQNCIDDREHEDEREPNGDETDFDGGEIDASIFIPGGGSVGQYEDGWRPVPGSAVAPSVTKKARRLKGGDVVREYTAPIRLLPDAVPMLSASDFNRLPWA